MAGKVVFITGCSSGIGRALALEFSRAGWLVAATARKPESVSDLKELGMIAESLDVTQGETIETAVKNILAKTGRIDMLVNNAGFGLMGPALEISLEENQKQMETNFFGPIELIKAVAPVMKSQGSGTIVNMGSISGIAAMPFSGAYCASKAALHSYSDALRMELKPFGIKVVTVQPGAIISEFGRNAGKTIERTLKPGSWYANIERYVHKRAQTSQQDATPAEGLARKLVPLVSKTNPPAVIRLGKKSFLLPFLKNILPHKTLDAILSKRFGLRNL